MMVTLHSNTEIVICIHFHKPNYIYTLNLIFDTNWETNLFLKSDSFQKYTLKVLNYFVTSDKVIVVIANVWLKWLAVFFGSASFIKSLTSHNFM